MKQIEPEIVVLNDFKVTIFWWFFSRKDNVYIIEFLIFITKCLGCEYIHIYHKLESILTNYELGKEDTNNNQNNYLITSQDNEAREFQDVINAAREEESQSPIIPNEQQYQHHALSAWRSSAKRQCYRRSPGYYYHERSS